VLCLTGGKLEVLRVTRPTIALHGGAGSWDVDESTRIKVEGFLRDLARETLDLLDRDYSALDAVEYAVSKLEDSGLFNAGYGSSLNIEGVAQMDAGIMNGVDMRAGAVAIVERVRNPVKLARMVMENTDHVLIGGLGADLLARIFGLENRVINVDVVKRYKEMISRNPPHKRNNTLVKRLGLTIGDTVGAVAIDKKGGLAAATSTGGIWLKMIGRIGDSPIPGAGFYADRSIGCSATGIGETIMTISLCRSIGLHYRYLRDIAKAIEESFRELEDIFGINTAGVIVLTSDENYTSYYNTKGMARAVFSKNMREPIARI
jgi:beta-aspartyl-peptidase (threonine type)